MGSSCEGIERKLSIWKSKFLSLGGRITLIKAAFSNLLVYFISLLGLGAQCLSPRELNEFFEITVVRQGVREHQFVDCGIILGIYVCSTS